MFTLIMFLCFFYLLALCTTLKVYFDSIDLVNRSETVVARIVIVFFTGLINHVTSGIQYIGI